MVLLSLNDTFPFVCFCQQSDDTAMLQLLCSKTRKDNLLICLILQGSYTHETRKLGIQVDCKAFNMADVWSAGYEVFGYTILDHNIIKWGRQFHFSPVPQKLWKPSTTYFTRLGWLQSCSCWGTKSSLAAVDWTQTIVFVIMCSNSH